MRIPSRIYRAAFLDTKMKFDAGIDPVESPGELSDGHRESSELVSPGLVYLSLRGLVYR